MWKFSCRNRIFVYPYNINFDKVPLPDKIKDVYQDIINTISKLRPDEAKLKEAEDYIENQYMDSLEYEITGAISQTMSRDIVSIPTLMKCSKNPYFPFLINTGINIPGATPFRDIRTGEETINIIINSIKEWKRIIQLYEIYK